MRQNYGSAHHLIGVLRINSEPHGDFHGLIELGVFHFLQQWYRVLELIGAALDRLPRFLDGSRAQLVLAWCEWAAGHGIDGAAAYAAGSGRTTLEQIRAVDASGVHGTLFDVAVMTGNVAQAIVETTAWSDTLRAAHAALRRDGQLVFETRDPRRREWEQWGDELGTMPLISSRVIDRRAPAASNAWDTTMLFDTVFPVRK